MKNKWLKNVSIVMSAMLLMTGCGSAAGENTPTSAGSEEQTQTEVGIEAESNVEESAADDKALFDGEDTELLVIFPGSNAAPADLENVQNEVNKIVSEYMDAHVKFQIIEWGAYGDQCNLMMSSGEKADLMWTTRTTQYGPKGQLMDVKDLLPVYAPGALAEMNTYVNACYVDGELYGLPTFHDISKSSGICFRKDIADELGIDTDALKTWDDVDAMLAKVKEAYPNMDILVPGTTSDGELAGMKTAYFDELENVGAGVLYSSTEPEIVNLYATDDFKEMCLLAKDWNQKGYFIADAATVTETRQNYISAGNAFGYIVGTIYPGFEVQETANCGTEMVVCPINEATITTNAAKASQWVIPAACESPEKALTFMELLYTNADVQNLFFYGVEGLDYVVKDADNGQIGYPDGVDASNVGWSNETWITGNGSIAYTREGSDPDLWSQLVEFNESGKKSAIYGFLYNNSNITNEITALSNVISKYKAILLCGAVDDVEGTLDTFNQELESAGMQKVIDDMQEQVDAWVATK